MPRAKLARYILHAIERFRSGSKSPEMISNTDEESVNLEHVLPKNAKDADWPAFDAEERNAFVHRLGNMVLLDAKKNKRIGNKPWSAKRAILATSALILSKTAAAHDEWDPQVIENRQNEMAKDAVKILRRQP